MKSKLYFILTIIIFLYDVIYIPLEMYLSYLGDPHISNIGENKTPLISTITLIVILFTLLLEIMFNRVSEKFEIKYNTKIVNVILYIGGVILLGFLRSFAN